MRSDWGRITRRRSNTNVFGCRVLLCYIRKRRTDPSPRRPQWTSFCKLRRTSKAFVDECVDTNDTGVLKDLQTPRSWMPHRKLTSMFMRLQLAVTMKFEDGLTFDGLQLASIEVYGLLRRNCLSGLVCCSGKWADGCHMFVWMFHRRSSPAFPEFCL